MSGLLKPVNPVYMLYFDPSKHHRRSCRLKGYDYSKKGLYFITNCCKNFDCLFGEVANGVMILNEAGEMISRSWLALTERYGNIKLHEFIVMPNHFHGIIEITALSPLLIAPTVGSTLVVDQSPITDQFINENKNCENMETGQPQGLPGQKNHQGFEIDRNITIGDVIAAFKSITTVEYIRGVKLLKWKPFYKNVWQREYFDVIIRNDTILELISQYIADNPKKWRNDKFHSSI